MKIMLRILILAPFLLLFASCESKDKENKQKENVLLIEEKHSKDQTSTKKEEQKENHQEERKEDQQENYQGEQQEKQQENRQGTLPSDSLPEGVSYDNYSNEKKAWWFKRNKEHQPSGADDSIDLKQYDAYYLGDTSQKVIYLTFDCGYENGYTESMLDTLNKYNIKACFFVTKTYIRDNPELVKRMKEEGHQVGNHTVTHKSQPTLNIEEIEKELGDCSNYMKEITGYDMDPFFRPPMGEYSERTLKVSQDMGYTTVLWSIAYLDYDVNNQPGSNYVEEHFRTYYHNGAIPLIHNVSSANCKALEEVILLLEKEGYRFCTLYELENATSDTTVNDTKKNDEKKQQMDSSKDI